MEAVEDAAEEGYTVASLSGGEPLLYRPLRRLLTRAKASGLHTTVTTNGMLLDARRRARLEGVADLVAISLDGVPESHNRIRGSDRAFDRMHARLEGLRTSGIPFGFIFTLTQHNLPELEWVARFAAEEGAQLLQIHPLEEVGRAASALPGERPDELEASVTYLEAARLQQEVGSDLAIQVDVVHRGVMRAHPDRVYAGSGETEDDVADRPLSALVSPLVIEADGTVVPLQYGFARRFALGALTEAPLRALAPRWKAERALAFRRLCRAVYAAESGPPARSNAADEPSAQADNGHNSEERTSSPEENPGYPFFNWYEAVTQRSHAGVDNA
jgi:MoaA/NifB/PqqE/SkfB family radical SAM enzyme